jgi:hypothetical protein
MAFMAFTIALPSVTTDFMVRNWDYVPEIGHALEPTGNGWIFRNLEIPGQKMTSCVRARLVINFGWQPTSGTDMSLYFGGLDFSENWKCSFLFKQLVTVSSSPPPFA